MHFSRPLPFVSGIALLVAASLGSSAAWGQPTAKKGAAALARKSAAAPEKRSPPPVKQGRVRSPVVEKQRMQPGKPAPARRSTAGAKPRARPAKKQLRDRFPPMRLVHANSREKLTVRLYDRQGRTSKAAVRELTHFLRCHATGKRHPLHWRLLQNLYRISRRFDGKTIVVYSGFRARKVASSRTSRHVRGMAIDLQVEGVSNRQLRDYLMASFKPCGVGYYPKGSFIHFDVRQDRSAFWVDYSGKGEPAAYANDPYAVLKQERAGGKAATLALAQERAGASGLSATVTAAAGAAGGVPPAVGADSEPAAAPAPQPTIVAKAAAGAAVPAPSTAAALSAPGARTPALPVIQPDIPPLGMIDLPPSRGAAKQPRPPISSYGAGAAQGPFSSAMRPLAGGRISLAP